MSGGMERQRRSPKGRSRLRVASYGLVAVGAVLLLAAGVSVGYRRWEGRQLQVRLTQTAVSLPRKAMPTLAVRAAATSPAPSPEPTGIAAIIVEPEASALASPQAMGQTPSTPAEPTVEAIPAGDPPVRLTIPDLGIDAQVVQMGWKVQEVDGTPMSVWRLEDISNGKAGHLINSALPGQPDNVVIAGHHNIEGQVFRSISDAWSDEGAEVLQENLQWRSPALNGRAITVHDAGGRQFTYVIEAMYKLADRDVSWEQRLANGRFMASTGEPVLTLVTCWPSNNNSHRIVVVARLEIGES